MLYTSNSNKCINCVDSCYCVVLLTVQPSNAWHPFINIHSNVRFHMITSFTRCIFLSSVDICVVACFKAETDFNFLISWPGKQSSCRFFFHQLFSLLFSNFNNLITVFDLFWHARVCVCLRVSVKHIHSACKMPHQIIYLVAKKKSQNLMDYDLRWKFNGKMETSN